ncbi:hypothetical protein ABFS82_04G107400 [Erythranthe guttata]|uniref:BED-type domain-containing protein n=1 Tax=Erythranthe guttata TaxID=4155 RepID=A0A022QAJ5_ERYGU|nr:PREDICTED: zinc finger BED domain-containing protein DAYSLEEPER-like [Erythranthe guttata]EYU24629.1 hypothetical protein MIMGU_mgv1a023531mg [Erythranthe guttata]|eukprot:XP_012852824.1 PREDICTED: zinc finger BED domain-containing protein DAYSLEEPER-like [Erythranthe guttata]
MDISINQNAFPDPDPKPNKRRRKKSMVWEHFTIETVNADCVKANCNLCKKSFAYISGSKLAGTSHLKRHISMGICPVTRHNQQKDQLSIQAPPPPKPKISENGTSSNSPRKRHRAANGAVSIYSNGGNNWSHDLAKMIILHDYPLHMVEHAGFIDFTRNLQPQFNVSSVATVQEQIMGIYTREKHKVMDLLRVIPGRLNITVDVWTSDKSYESLAYVLLTGHFIDHDLKLQRRILNFIAVEFPDSDTALSEGIAACLTDWNVEEKLLTITLDRSYCSQKARENLRNLLPMKNSLTLNGQLVIDSCYARMLSSLAQDAIESMRVTIEKVRHSVKHVEPGEDRTIEESHNEIFVKLKQELQHPSTKRLKIDDVTKWDTTYHMLVAAYEVKDVLSKLEREDPDYKCRISEKEWEQVAILCSFLKLLFDAANVLTRPVYPTTNIFSSQVVDIHKEFTEAAATSSDPFRITLTKPLREKFMRYWESCNLVIAMAAVMDPRMKMDYVAFNSTRIYGEDAGTWVKIVNDSLHELFLQYVMHSHLGPAFAEEEAIDPLVKMEMPCQEDALLSSVDGLIDFDIDISDIMGESHTKLEIDQYLEESILPRVQEFDVLGWWRVNTYRYPTLSRMAFDVLSIPMSTTPTESVFDTRERKVDDYRSSLRPSTLDALFCAKDWLRYNTELPSSIVPAATAKTEFY